MSTERIDAILQAFDSTPAKYQRAEVEEALALREEIAPRLLAVLDELVADPEKFNGEHALLHMYAVALLAHFKEPRAHLPVIRAFNLSPEIEYRLWAEMTTDLLPVLLLQTCDGKVDAIKELVLDKTANDMARSSAMEALSLAVHMGLVQREEILGFFGGLFTGAEADRSSDFFWSNLASAATDLWPKEILSAIKKAYDDGLITERSIPWGDVEESAAEPKEEWLARERKRAEQSIPKDVHGYMSWLACFEPEDIDVGPHARAASTEPATGTTVEKIERIIQGFDSIADEYREAEVDEAVALREAITPRLIAVLEELAATPERFEEQHRRAHLYAATLLAHFREAKAHLPIIKAFTVSKEDQDYWGDMVTEDLDRLLFMTCDGNVEAIKVLILNKDANEYVRSAAMRALDLAVLNDVYPREEAIRFYGRLFTGTEDKEGSDFWSMLTSAATHIYPEELLPTIKKAYEDGLVYSGYIGLNNVEAAVAAGKEATLAEEKRRANRQIHENVHDYMSWWACFHPKRELRGERREQQEEAERQGKQREREKEKAKKKAAKKAKKKNRR
jgi:hypothetical protein